MKQYEKLKRCRTAGQLIKELERLPKGFLIKQGIGNGVLPVVLERRQEGGEYKPCIQFED